MTIPTRSNAERIDASWFNGLRDAIEYSGFALNYLTITADHSATMLEGNIGIEATSNTVQVTLPSAIDNEGKKIYVKGLNIDNAATVYETGNATIYTLTEVGEVVAFVSDNSNWLVFNNADLLAAHKLDTSTHGVGEIVGTGEVQVLGNKFIDGDFNTITNLEHGAEVDNPTAAHGVTTVAGIEEAQTFTNKTHTLPKLNEDVELTSTSTELNQLDSVNIGGNTSGDVVTTDGTQTLTNKTLTNCTLDGTTTIVSSDDLNVTDKNIIINKDGTEASAIGAGLTVEKSDATDSGMTHDNTLASEWKCGEIGSETEVVTVSTTQTLTNKTHTSPKINEDVELAVTSTELNQLDDVTVGGTTAGDIVTLDATQTLTNKTHTLPKVNEDVELAATATELNQLDDVAVGGTSTGDIVTIDDTQLITGKVYDGATASDASKIILPKNTTTNLDGLTDTEGSIAYDTTLDTIVVNDGSNWNEISGGGGTGVGDSSIYKVLNADDDSYASWTDNTVNATWSEETVNHLNGNKSFKLTNHVSAAGESVDTINIPVPLRSRDKQNGIKFQYTYLGTSDYIKMDAYDVTNAAIIGSTSLVTTTKSTAGMVIANVPDDCLNIQLRPTIVTGEAFDLVFDDIEFTDHPYDMITTVESPDTVTKILVSDVYVSGYIPSLEFTGLEIGKQYDLDGNVGFFHSLSGTGQNGHLLIANGSQDITRPRMYSTEGSVVVFAVGGKFTATSSTVTAYLTLPSGSTSSLQGNNTRQNTYLQLSKVTAPTDNVVIAGVRGEIGEVIPFASEELPENFLACEGQAISRTSFDQLYDAIGTLHGVGDGSTTFNVPDLRDEFIRGAHSGRSVGATEADSTAVNGLDVTAYSGSKTSGNVSANHSHYGGVASSIAGTKYGSTWDSSAAYAAVSAAAAAYLAKTGLQDTNHTHTTDIGHDHGMSGDAETRPQNVALKYGIRYTGTKTLYALPTSEQQDFEATSNSTTGVLGSFGIGGRFATLITKSATGTYQYTIDTTKFSEMPSLLPAGIGNSALSVSIGAVAYPTFWVIVRDTTNLGVTIDGSFTLEATRKGADAKAPGVYIGEFTPQQVAYIKDIKGTSVSAGGFTSGSMVTRELNSLSGNLNITLSSNQFTLPRGEYTIWFSAPAYRVNRHKVALYDVTDANYAIYGSSESTESTDITSTTSVGQGYFYLSEDKTFEIRHRCSATKTTNGLGIHSGFGDEVYTQVKITKIGMK